MPQIAERFGVKEPTVRKRIEREQLILVSKLIPQMQRQVAQKAAEKAVDKWMERGEKHRDVAFELAHESLKKMKPVAPKNFREAEAADKIARRAAGLDVTDTVQQTLININEAMEAADEPRPIKATVVEAEEIIPREESVPATAERPALTNSES